MLPGFNNVLSSGSFSGKIWFWLFLQESRFHVFSVFFSNRMTHLAGPPVVHTKKNHCGRNRCCFFCQMLPLVSEDRIYGRKLTPRCWPCIRCMCCFFRKRHFQNLEWNVGLKIVHGCWIYHPTDVTVTTRIMTCLVGNPLVAFICHWHPGWEVDPTYMKHMGLLAYIKNFLNFKLPQSTYIMKKTHYQQHPKNVCF